MTFRYALPGLLLVAAPGLLRAGTPLLSTQVVVASLKPGSPAARAGLQAGDRILALDDQVAPGLEALLASAFDLGWVRPVRISVLRQGVTLAFTLPMGDWDLELRPDLTEAALQTLGEARARLAAPETWQEGQRLWLELESSLWTASPDTAAWLCLERAKALAAGRHAQEADEARGTVATRRAGSFWAGFALTQRAAAFGGTRESGQGLAYQAEALALARASAAPGREARTVYVRAILEYQRGNLAEAEAQAEAAHRQFLALAPESVALANCLNMLGGIALMRGDLARAEERYLSTRVLRERFQPLSREAAIVHSNLGAVWMSQGRYPASRESYDKALAVYLVAAPGSLEQAGCWYNLGNLKMKLGDSSGAQQLFLEAQRVFVRIAPNGPQAAECLQNLGIVAMYQGDLATARQAFQQALELFEGAAPGGISSAKTLNNLGNLAEQTGDGEAGTAYAQRALAIQERLVPGSLDVANTLDGLAIRAGDRGDTKTKLELLLKAKAIRERQGPAGAVVAASFDRLGELALESRDWATAKDWLEKARAIWKAQLPEGSEAASNLLSLGELAQGEGKLAQARQYFEASLANQKARQAYSTDMADTQLKLARLDQAAGNPQAALTHRLLGLDLLERNRAKVGGEASRSSFGAAHGEFYSELIGNQLDLGLPREALETLERGRSQTLLEMLASRTIDLKGEVPAELLERRRALGRRQKELSDQLAGAEPQTDPKLLESWRSELVLLPQQHDALAEEVRKASPRLAALEAPQPLKFEAMRRALAPGTLLVAYCTNATETYLFALTRESKQPKAVRLPLGELALRDKVKQFRELVGPKAATGAGAAAWQPEARALYRLLLGPITKELAASRRILLLPDSPLHLLPFRALLPAAAPGLSASKPLGLQRPISLQPSLTVYATLRAQRRQQPARAWVGFGDPVYENLGKAGELRGEVSVFKRNGMTLAPLPGTRDEVEGISALFPKGAQTRLGEQATEEAVNALPKGTPFLHFACHGVVDSRFPMNSALVLSLPKQVEGFQDHRTDGLLQAWEIMQDLKLDTDCVVLSACETGLGKDQGGEGVLGLSRAFFYAGARSLLVSQWSIADESTAELMKVFYRELLAGHPRDEALRRAQAALARGGAYSHPFYWAAFDLHGTPD